MLPTCTRLPNKHTLTADSLYLDSLTAYLINIPCLPRHAANSLTADSLIAYSLTAYTLTAYLINIPCIPNKQTLPTPTCCQHVPGYLINIPWQLTAYTLTAWQLPAWQLTAYTLTADSLTAWQLPPCSHKQDWGFFQFWAQKRAFRGREFGKI